MSAADHTDEYDVKHTDGGDLNPSASSCWLESEEDAVSLHGESDGSGADAYRLLRSRSVSTKRLGVAISAMTGL
jgi:hypothetical protein